MAVGHAIHEVIPAFIQPGTTTTVNLELFGDMVEDLISRLMDMVQKDQLTIALKGGAEELEKR